MSADPAPHTRGRDSEPGIVELCETHARMPVDIARWTAAGLPDHVTPDDLAPAAWEGLYDAAATWRPDRATAPFSSWAWRRITDCIHDGLRADDPIPRGRRAVHRRAWEARDSLTQRHGRHPTHAEVAAATGTPLADHLSLWAEAIGPAQPPLSTDEVLLDAWWPAPAGDDDAWLIGWCTAAVQALPPRLRYAVVETVWVGRSTIDVAADLGVHPSRVSQMRTEAFDMARDAVRWHLWRDPGRPLTGAVARRRDAYRQAVARHHTQP